MRFSRAILLSLSGALALCLAPGVARAEPGHRHVLLLYSYDQEFAAAAFSQAFQTSLSHSSPDPIDFIEVSVHAKPSAKQDPDESVIDDIRSTSGGVHLDLVVPIGGPAATFAQQNQPTLFRDTPVLFASVDNRFVDGQEFAPNETAVAVRHDLPQMLQTILRLLPDTRNVVVVTGASTHDQFWRREMQRAFQPFKSQLTFIWTNEWSFDELLQRSGTLPPHSVILYGLLMLDANGVPQREEQTLDALHARANAPLFGLHSPQLGHGIVGGPLISVEDASRDTAAVAVRLLQGEPAHAITPRVMAASAPMFDARELRRWGINPVRLQAGSIVRFRDSPAVSPWAASVLVGIAVGALVGFAGLFALPRRRAGGGSTVDADSGAASDAALARLSQRLLQAQEEERASIARWIEDDVCQKLAAISMDLHAIGAGELRDQLSALARESLAISDPVYAKLKLLGLATTIRSLAERRCAERDVALEISVRDVPQDLCQETSLALFRVFQEALGNALKHARTTRIVISLRRAAGVLALDVVDEGVGFDPEDIAPAEALGLTCMRERLHRVGGSCVIESRPGAGTRVRALVPVAI
jgi:signal transduction histidine kinase